MFTRIADFIRETDKILLILCTFCSCYGCLAVFSATRPDNNFRAVLVQVLSTVAGIAAAAVISTIDYEHFIKRWYVAAVLGVVPVILTFFIGIAPGETDDKAFASQ